MISHCLLKSAEAAGSLAELTGQLVKVMEHRNQSQPNTGLRPPVSPCMLLRSRDHSNYFSHLLFQLCSPNIQRFDISSLSSAVALEISSAMIASWAFARNPQGTSDDEQSYKKSCPYKLANLMKTFSYVIHLWVTDPVSVFCVGW